jgi:oxygen-independent coproporphyrinogen-3 oxidase
MQNVDTWEAYGAAIGRGEPPLGRAYRPTADERLIRELVLQLKKGAIQPDYFAGKFGVDVRDRFAGAWQSLAADGYLAEAAAHRIALNREGLLRVDMLLRRFFLPEHVSVRYT